MEGVRHTSECIHRYQLPKSYFFVGPMREVEVTSIVVRIYEDGYVDTENIGFNLTTKGKRRKGSADGHVWVTDLEAEKPEEYRQLIDSLVLDAINHGKGREN